MSAAYAVKPGSIADSSATARQNGPRTIEMRRGTRAHLSIVGDVPARAASAVATSTGQSTTVDRTTVDRANAGQPAVVRTRLRLTRRGRVVFTALAAVPIVLGSIAIAVNGGVAAAEGTATVGVAAFDYVTIESGQSLWQLAESIAPSQDPRDVIADIVNLNQLPSEAVQPGQRIALPAGY